MHEYLDRCFGSSRHSRGVSVSYCIGEQGNDAAIPESMSGE